MKTMRLLQGFVLSPALSVLALASAAPTHAQTISRFDGCPGVGVSGILNLPTHASVRACPWVILPTAVTMSLRSMFRSTYRQGVTLPRSPWQSIATPHRRWS